MNHDTYKKSFIIKGEPEELEKLGATLKSITPANIAAVITPLRIIRHGDPSDIDGPVSREIMDKISRREIATRLEIQHNGDAQAFKAFILKNYKVTIS